jgi:polyisoprenoid-binding protein YceI
MSRLRPACLAALWLAGAPAAADGVLRVDPARSAVRFTLAATLHTVHGVGRVARGELRFDPAGGAAAGEVVVDARSFATGIAARDRDMHEKVLESARFPEIRFEAERLEVTSRAHEVAEVILHGAFAIHGSRHALAVPGRVVRDGGTLRVEASFAVPYVAWGLRDVSNFVLRVADTLDVQVELVGSLVLSEPADPASRAAP